MLWWQIFLLGSTYWPSLFYYGINKEINIYGLCFLQLLTSVMELYKLNFHPTVSQQVSFPEKLLLSYFTLNFLQISLQYWIAKQNICP